MVCATENYIQFDLKSNLIHRDFVNHSKMDWLIYQTLSDYLQVYITKGKDTYVFGRISVILMFKCSFTDIILLNEMNVLLVV